MNTRYSYGVLTTDFDLQPVLAEYLAKYPKGRVESCQIVFRADNEPDQGMISYLVVFTLKQQEEHSLTFEEFLDAYCKVNDKLALADTLDHGFPDRRTPMKTLPYRVYGRLKK